MHWNTKRTARVICRRSIVVALAAIVAAGSTAGSLLAAGPLKPKSRVAIDATPQPSGHPAASLSSPPPISILPPQTTPGWFPEAPDGYAPGQRDNEYQELRRLLLEGGDKIDPNGCLSEDEARALFKEILGTGYPLDAQKLDKWLKGRDYLRSNPRRRLQIAKKVIETFGGGGAGLNFEKFKKFLYWLGLMCS